MYLVTSRVKAKAHAADKRVGADFLLRFNAFIDRKLDEALEIHNGGRKTLDGAVADHVLGCHA